MNQNKVVLRAYWTEMVALNFQIDASILQGIVPKDLEIDLHNDAAYISLVCANCRDIRIWGLPLPISRGYKNVFLRYYVKHRVGKQVKRGSCLVKGFVSNAIARWTVARSIHTEVVRARIRASNSGFDGSQGVDTIPEADYQWSHENHGGKLKIKARHRINNLAPETKVGFILDRNHHFVSENGKTLDYPMQITSSNVWDAAHASFSCDTAELFGRQFAKAMSRRPVSVFLAEKNTTYYYSPSTVAQ